MDAWPAEVCTANVASTPLRVAELQPSGTAAARTSRRLPFFRVVVVVIFSLLILAGHSATDALLMARGVWGMPKAR